MIDFGRVMRRVEHHVRKGLVHYAAEPIVKRLLHWKRPHRVDVEVTITALASELHIGRKRIVDVLRDLERLGVLTKVRQWLYLPELRKKVQTVNRYVFSAAPPEFPGGTTSIQEGKKEALEERARGMLRFWKPRIAPHPPVRTVQEQLALLRGG